MTKDQWMQEFEQAGVFRDGHYRTKAGMHITTYCDKHRMFARRELMEQVFAELARCLYLKIHVEVVIGPALGGIDLAAGVAWHLQQKGNHFVRAVYAEKVSGGGFCIHQSFLEFVRDKNVAIVEDTVTTGSSVLEVADEVQHRKGRVVGVASTLLRGKIGAHRFGVPYSTLCDVSDDPRFRMWNPELEKCPKCEEGIPPDLHLGHGRKR